MFTYSQVYVIDLILFIINSINRFCFVGLNEQTIHGLADVCSLIKNLKYKKSQIINYSFAYL
jgi:hypothetical protein